MTKEELNAKLYPAIIPGGVNIFAYGDVLRLEFEGPLKFSDLDAISSILKTERIDINAETEGHGCDTCGYGASTNVVLTCYGVKLDK